MRHRDLPTLIDLAKRVRAHCRAGPWSDEASDRMNDAHLAFRAGEIGTGDQNIYDVCRTHRWVASWNRRERFVAEVLAEALADLGISREMLPLINHVPREPMPPPRPKKSSTVTGLSATVAWPREWRSPQQAEEEWRRVLTLGLGYPKGVIIDVKDVQIDDVTLRNYYVLRGTYDAIFPESLEFEPDDLVERVAALEHEQWAHSTAHLLHMLDFIIYDARMEQVRAKMSTAQSPPGMMAWDEFEKNAEAIVRWRRQIDTPYAELSEEEKESDREWARKVLAVVQAAA